MDINAFMSTPTPQLADMLMQAHPDVDPSAAAKALKASGGLAGATQVGAAPPPNAGFGVAGTGQTTGDMATAAANPTVPAATPGVNPQALVGLAKAVQPGAPPQVQPVHVGAAPPAKFINPQTMQSPANVGPVRRRAGSLGEILGGLK